MSDSELRLLTKDNAFGRLPDDLEGFEPEEIVHIVLKIDLSEKGKIQFKAELPKDPPPPLKKTGNEPPPAKSIEDYAKDVASRVGLILGTMPAPSPYDIGVSRQCWVLLQLDPEIDNWQFAKGEFGCTTKSPPKGRNCGLRHAYSTRLGDVGKPVEEEGCKVLYFGVVRRGKNCKPPEPNRPPGELFNFHTEFLQLVNGAATRMPVIFDPDIKNDSDNNTIPPGE